MVPMNSQLFRTMSQIIDELVGRQPDLTLSVSSDQSDHPRSASPRQVAICTESLPVPKHGTSQIPSAVFEMLVRQYAGHGSNRAGELATKAGSRYKALLIVAISPCHPLHPYRTRSAKLEIPEPARTASPPTVYGEADDRSWSSRRGMRHPSTAMSALAPGARGDH